MTRGEAVNWLINIMADIGKAEHSELWHYEQALSEIREILESEPERKKGKWIPQDRNKSYGRMITAVYYYPKCSVCGWSADNTNFCPNCGSDMRGDPDD